MSDSSETRKPRVAIVGCFQNGKSTLVNCLLDGRVAQTGNGLATTHICTTYTWGEVEQVTLHRDGKPNQQVSLEEFLTPSGKEDLAGCRNATVELWKPLLQDIDLTDTPGFNADEKDDSIATASMTKADFLFVVLANRGLNEIERRILATIDRFSRPFSILLNCSDFTGAKWDPVAPVNDKLVKEVEAVMQNSGRKPVPIAAGSNVWPCNLAWFWTASGHLARDRESYSPEILQDNVRSHFLKKGLPSTRELAAKSRFLEVRLFLAKYPFRALESVEGVGQTILNKAEQNWKLALTEALDAAKVGRAERGG